jgi:hypothetical protein
MPRCGHSAMFWPTAMTRLPPSLRDPRGVEGLRPEGDYGDDGAYNPQSGPEVSTSHSRPQGGTGHVFG